MGIVAQASGREGALKLGMMEMAMVISSVGPLFFLSFLAFEFGVFPPELKKGGGEDPLDPLTKEIMQMVYSFQSMSLSL